MSKLYTNPSGSLSFPSSRAPFLTNPFGRHFSYYNKQTKTIHSKQNCPSNPKKSFRIVSSVSNLNKIENSGLFKIKRSGSLSSRENLSMELMAKPRLDQRNHSNNKKT
jgi:hypothetical protein